MNEKNKPKEIRDEALENVNGGTVFGILPGFDTSMRDQQNSENRKNPAELNDDTLAGVSGGECLPAILIPFGEDMILPTHSTDDTYNTVEQG